MLLVFLRGLVYILLRQVERQKKINPGHKPVVSKAPVFKLTKRGNAFRLKSETTASVKHIHVSIGSNQTPKKKGMEILSESLSFSMRARNCAIRLLYGSESDCLGSIKQKHCRSHLRTINRPSGKKQSLTNENLILGTFQVSD